MAAASLAVLLRAAANAPPPSPWPCTCAEPRWCAPLATAPPDHEVFPFVIGGDNNFGPPSSVNDSAAWYAFDWDIITTAAWSLYDMEHVCFAHKHGARVVTAASAFDAAGQAKLSAMLTNATARTGLVAELVETIARAGARRGDAGL